MGYGGPRVEFYTANQYANYAAAIQREDAARVRSIVDRRTSVPESEKLRQREEAFRAYEQAQAAEADHERAVEAAALQEREQHEERQRRRLARRGRHGSLTANQAASRHSRPGRLLQLSRPRPVADAAHGSHATYGRVMHPRSCKVEYPTGRNNAPYCPGIDRDRIVPPRPQLQGTTPPWVGSYSTHHGPQERETEAAQAEAAYYCRPPAKTRTAQAEAERQQTLANIVAEQQAAALAKGCDGAAVDGQAAHQSNTGGAAGLTFGPATVMGDDDADDRSSVFSHGSSNGPIRATGNMHVSTVSTKESVQLHLSRYGGAMTAPRASGRGQQVPAKDLTLPELSARLVRMQAPSSYK